MGRLRSRWDQGAKREQVEALHICYGRPFLRLGFVHKKYKNKNKEAFLQTREPNKSDIRPRYN